MYVNVRKFEFNKHSLASVSFYTYFVFCFFLEVSFHSTGSERNTIHFMIDDM